MITSIPKHSLSTWTNLAFAPIRVFSPQDFGIKTSEFIKKNQQIFHQLPFDYYDMRRSQIEYLLEIRPELSSTLSVWGNYFLGNVKKEELPLFSSLSELEKKSFLEKEPFRKRAVAKFDVEKTVLRPIVKRDLISTFSQTKVEGTDFRKLPRIFSPLDEKLVDPTLIQLIQGISSLIFTMHPDKKRLEFVTHFMKVISSENQIRGNSPEGIHQDGYPFLVTAIVIDLKNVQKGGESIIYDETKKVEIFKTVLRPGFGILQPDLGTKIWHQVTPICPLPKKVAQRSIIGFDIGFKE